MGESLLRQESATCLLALLERSEWSWAVLTHLLLLQAAEVGKLYFEVHCVRSCMGSVQHEVREPSFGHKEAACD